ncbi:hypothetical protein ACFODL_00245 [Phenylobacterium terrae]|uniref:Uncharacterized protein n=2 Tax=Phenylobacterium terrae TaxID=2665495 RepID=A0ABW4MX45_9CAUL
MRRTRSGYIPPMFSRLFFPMIGLVAAGLIGLAMVWPQGLGARSPGPFGETPYQQRPEVQAAIRRQHEAAMAEAERARQAVSDLQAQAVAPTE